MIFFLIFVSSVFGQQGWRIVIGGEAGVVEQTASKELRLFFKGVLDEDTSVITEDSDGIKGRCVVIGMVSSNGIIKKAHSKGLFKELDVKEVRNDAFEIVVENEMI